MDGDHKLIYHQLKPKQHEFYDLRADSGELVNLAANSPPEMQAMLNDLKSLEPFSDILPGMTAADLKRIRKLRSLGYIQ